MQYLSDKKLALRYDVSRSTIWRWLSEQKLPQPVKLHGTSTRWLISDLERWESEQKMGA